MNYEAPSKIHEYDFDGDMHHFKSPSFDAMVTPNHRMVVKPYWAIHHVMKNTGLGRPIRYDRDKWNFIHAEDLTGEMVMPWATKWEDTHCIEKILGYDADMFLQFLGWWISEGWVNKVSGGLGVCQGVGELADRMSHTMAKCGIKTTERVGRPGTGGTINGWKAYIGVKGNRELCKWIPEHCGIGAKNKKLPRLIWSLSNRQKWVLLEALIDGDGSKGYKDSYKYFTTSFQLAEQVQRLAIECGRMSSISEKPPAKKHHSLSYQVNIGSRSRKTIGLSQKRHKTMEYYKGKVYCLTVPTGAYMIRRHKKVGIYGNSANFFNKSDNIIAVHREKDRTLNPENFVEIWIQKIRKKGTGELGCYHLKYHYGTGTYQDVSREGDYPS
jgi:hypothetical protein